MLESKMQNLYLAKRIKKGIPSKNVHALLKSSSKDDISGSMYSITQYPLQNDEICSILKHWYRKDYSEFYPLSQTPVINSLPKE